jgi:Zn-finger nucleic acid-binding protein
MRRNKDVAVPASLQAKIKLLDRYTMDMRWALELDYIPKHDQYYFKRELNDVLKRMQVLSERAAYWKRDQKKNPRKRKNAYGEPAYFGRRKKGFYAIGSGRTPEGLKIFLRYDGQFYITSSEGELYRSRSVSDRTAKGHRALERAEKKFSVLMGF